MTNETMKTSRVTAQDDTINQLNERLQKRNTYSLRKRSSFGPGIFGAGRTEKKKKTVISRNFYMRECFKYVEKVENVENFENVENVCGCGRPRSKHPDKFTTKSKFTKDVASWSADKCTRRLPTDTYGEIEFTEDKSSRKPYIRIEHDTNATNLLNLLRNVWKLEVPNLVISVTGGARNFKLKPRLREVFSKGLIKVAASTGAWVITGGTNTGVMKHVGEAVKNRGSVGKFGRSNINIIGIAAWGIIDSSHLLVSKHGDGCYPACYDVTRTGPDHNHSHFLFVDNGTVGEYGTEIELRARVEEAIANELKTESFCDSAAIGIPVVLLVLEGGPNTIKTMLEAIKKGTPAVVIAGSGRAADVVSFAYKHLKHDEQQDISIINPEFVDEILHKVKEVFGEISMLSVYKEIEELLKHDKMVSIFRLEDGGGQSDMDLAILRALLKANTGSVIMQIKLALAWNRIDVAKSEIFKEDLKMENIDGIFESMSAALLDDKYDFVELFLNEGLNLKVFLTLERLESLYNKIPLLAGVRHLIDENLHLSKLNSPTVDMEVIGNVIEDLMGDRYKSRYRQLECYKPRVDRQAKCSVVRLVRKEVDNGVATPYLDLFIWAVLCNRKELSMLIWERTSDKVACALMASKLLKALADKIIDNRELSYMADELKENGDYYEKVAVGVLNECCLESEHHTQTLLVKELNNFGHLTSLDIAVEADNQDFVAHSSCQTLLTKLWMGALHVNTEGWKVLVCIFVPFLVPVLIKLRADCEEDEYPTSKDRGIEHKSQLDMDRDFTQHSLNNSTTNSTVGSEHSLDRELHPNVPFDLKEDTHTILDHLGGEEEGVDIILRDPHCKIGHFHRLVHFHEAPYVKFTASVIFYVAFLALYAGVLLTSLHIKVHKLEYLLQFWVLTLIMEEIRQILTQDSKYFLGKLEFYFNDNWNINDMLSLFLYVLATIFRYVAYGKGDIDGDNFLIAARIIYSLDIVSFIIRMLQIFSVFKKLGPKMVMIKNMLNDLGYFVVILIVFIVCYGVASQAVQYPNQSLRNAIVGALNIPYWQMYGELFLDNIVEDQLNATTGLRICDQPDAEPCSTEYGKWVAPVYMAIYMLFANILLLNLLIAIFNNTYQRVEEHSDKVWKFQRYDLITAYNDRPSLCPPFIIISHIYGLCRYVIEHCRWCGFSPAEGSSLKMTLSQQEEEDLCLWEDVQAENYIYHRELRDAETQDSRLKAIMSKLNIVAEQIEHIKTSDNEGSLSMVQYRRESSRPETKHGNRSRSNTNVIESRLANLEHNMEYISEILIDQNQNLAAIREASEYIMKNSTHQIAIQGAATGSIVAKSKITNIHMKSRLSPYPGSTMQRFKVLDLQVMWEVLFQDYDPPTYTSLGVLEGPYWADVDLMTLSPKPKLAYNEYDEVNKVNRISYVGTYEVVDGLPRNPYGRTGITGRGNLGRFGPNHAADPIATRWKRTSSGIAVDNGKRILEFIAIQRRDNHQWAIPGGMVEPGEHVSETLNKEFTEEALSKLDMSEEKMKQLSDRVKYLFRNGVEVYKGYVDDPRNTDNAWMETVACNFHDDTGEVFGEFKLQAGDDAQAVRWQRVSGNIPLFASHVGILEKVAKMHGASFY